MRRLLVFFILTGLSLQCIFTACTAGKWSGSMEWSDDRTKSLPDQNDYPDANAVILLDEAAVEISNLENISYSTMTRHRVVKILNAKGLRHANFVIPFDEDTEITRLEARTIRPDGRILMLDRHKIFETSLYPDYVFYSDLKGKRFTMPGAEPGSVLEFRWQIQVKNFTFWTRWPFQQADPVLISRFSIRCPRSWDIQWKSYGLDLKPEILNGGGSFSTYRWEVRNLEKLRPEVGMPAGMTDSPGLLFSPVGITSWEDVSKWYTALAHERMEPDDLIRQTVDSLIHGTQNDREKMRKIFEFVRDRVRYLAIEIGIGGYQPHPAPEVISNLYGDCKDMTTLIVAMADAAGIDADPVLISTWQNGRLDTSLVTPAQFNHAIAVVTLSDSSRIWMDATDKQCAFGDLPWFDQNRLVLVIGDSAETEIVRTPMDSHEKNLTRRRWDVELGADGSVRGEVSMELKGPSGRNIRQLLQFESGDVVDDWCTEEILARFPGAVVDQTDISGLDAPGTPLIIQIRYTLPPPQKSSEQYYTLQPGRWSRQEWHRLFASRQRYSDILFEYPLTIQDEIVITYPETWVLLSTLDSSSLSESFGGYYYGLKKADANQIQYKRYFRLSETQIHRSDYDRLRSFLNEVGNRDLKDIIFQIK